MSAELRRRVEVEVDLKKKNKKLCPSVSSYVDNGSSSSKATAKTTTADDDI